MTVSKTVSKTVSHIALRSAAAASLACVLFTGCRISENKNVDGKKDNVDISTPFGSMHVKGSDTVDTAAIGMSAYPGAVAVKDDDGKNSGSADVNLSFGDFHLGVKATSFQTTDQPDKVLAFYRKDMAHFGDIIECRGNATIGTPAKTSQGLTCKDKDNNHISTDDTHSKGVQIHGGGVSSDDNLELRAGSPQHQHIVGVEAKNGGTKIGIVALDLPTVHEGKDSE
jgi:hypothetical protein